MYPSSRLLPPLPLDNLKIWVLVPHLQIEDANIDYYYDFSQSLEEYTRTFAELELDWKWQPVTMNDYASVIEEIVREKEEGFYFPVVLNLCDGDEINGTPGISVVRLLKQRGLIYTGSDEYFYKITTSKIPMKEAFDKAGVPNADWEPIFSRDQDIAGIFKRLGSPIIIKPSVSGGSMGVGIKNVVKNENELKVQVEKMFDGYRGWNLATDGIIAESFICGPEYTVLIVGSYDRPEKMYVYTPVERIFHPSLPKNERFLSFDRLWEIYEDESPMPDEENFYEYELPEVVLIEEIKKLSLDAFIATRGKGYTRVDIRMDSNTRKLYVLEVNAQCGLSEDENYTSIGAILRLSGKTFSDLVVEIINDAFFRKVRKIRKPGKVRREKVYK